MAAPSDRQAWGNVAPNDVYTVTTRAFPGIWQQPLPGMKCRAGSSIAFGVH